MTTFRTTHPIDFDLYDKDTQNVLYIEDTSDQQLTLRIINASSQQITLGNLAGAVSDTNYHFALRFRPGTLSEASLSGPDHIQLTAATAADWEMTPPAQDAAGMDVIYLKSTTSDHTLDPASQLNILLQNTGADGSQGSRGTRVELLCTNMAYTGSPEPIDTNRELHLSIINHRGKKNIPLHIGFVGNNAVLNDGVTANTLQLRFTNTAVYDDTTPDKSQLRFPYNAIDDTKTAKIILAFDVGESTDEWALGTAAQLADIVVNQPVGWTVTEPLAGETPEWILNPDADVILPGRDAPPAGEANHFDINITNIISNFPTGHTHLHIRYQNIPGYWDGQRAVIFKKQPLIIHEGHVGIGTATPSAPLDVDGDVNVSGDIAASGNITASGDVGIGTNSPEAKLHITGGGLRQEHPGEVNIDSDTDTGGRLKILDNGNTGIGTTTPGFRLDVDGDINTSGKIRENGHVLLPAGTIVMWGGTPTPPGWAICDGTNGTPDLRDRFIVGAGSQYETDQTGGSNDVTLTTAEMPEHTHGVDDPEHSHETTWNLRNSSTDSNDSSLLVYARDNGAEQWSTTPETTGITIQNAGGGDPHENRPPYYALYFIIKL